VIDRSASSETSDDFHVEISAGFELQLLFCGLILA